MKKGVILVFLVLVLCTSVFAIEINIKETREVVKDTSTDDVDIIAPGKLKSKVTRHVYGLGHVADVTNGEITYLHQDRLGSTRLATNEQGEVVGEFKSLPFGQEIVNDDVRYSFATGKELDSSGLYYFGARYYDPNIGRFTSVDPVRDNHAYSYVNNNPMNYVDPDGRMIFFYGDFVQRASNAGYNVNDYLGYEPFKSLEQAKNTAYFLTPNLYRDLEKIKSLDAKAIAVSYGRGIAYNVATIFRSMAFDNTFLECFFHEAFHLKHIIQGDYYSFRDKMDEFVVGAYGPVDPEINDILTSVGEESRTIMETIGALDLLREKGEIPEVQYIAGTNHAASYLLMKRMEFGDAILEYEPKIQDQIVSELTDYTGILDFEYILQEIRQQQSQENP